MVLFSSKGGYEEEQRIFAQDYLVKCILSVLQGYFKHAIKRQAVASSYSGFSETSLCKETSEKNSRTVLVRICLCIMGSVVS